MTAPRAWSGISRPRYLKDSDAPPVEACDVVDTHLLTRNDLRRSG